jgi:Electron transfer DM13
MKKILFLALSVIFLASACKKQEIIVDNTPVVVAPTAKTLFSGTFVNGVHAVSGTAKVIQETDGKKYLVMENLKSDTGPDLRVYLSEDKTIKSATQILKGVPGGNSKTELPATLNLDKQKTVLIWCQQYSVHFGNAELK